MIALVGLFKQKSECVSIRSCISLKWFPTNRRCHGEATRPQFTTGAYGFGFQIGRPDEARTYGHGGSAPGMNAILRVYPESGQSVIVLCNLDSPSASRMGDWLHARMPLK
jgi:hypothetical protein